MDRISATLIVALFAGLLHSSSPLKFDETSKRHHIYWDPEVTELIRNPTSSLQVRMGHFMDIVCPLANLGIADDPAPPVLFDLYNVTKEGFENCNETGGRLIFACNLPDQENKLTIKFQRISPSPFGFRFQDCAEYYFLAVKRPSALTYGRDKSLSEGRNTAKNRCTAKSERLRIRVGCSDDKEDELKTDKTPSSTPKPRTTFVDRIRDELKKENAKKDTVVPGITDIPKKTPKKEKKAVSASRSDTKGENSASRTAPCSSSTALYACVLTLIWYSVLNSSS